MKCPICDFDNPNVEKFCINCGAEFIKTEEELELEANEVAEQNATVQQPVPTPTPPPYQVPPMPQGYPAQQAYQAPPMQPPANIPPTTQGYYAPPVQQQYQPYQQPPMYTPVPYAQPKPVNPGSSMGIASLIMGIIAFFTCGITAIPAIVTGIIGLSKSKDAGMKNSEAIGGICCAAASILFNAISFIIGFIEVAYSY